MRRSSKHKTRKLLERLFIIVAVIVITSLIVKASDDWLSGQNKNDSPCPAGMGFVPAAGGGFCLDLYEASPGKDCPYADPGGQSETRANLSATGCMSVSEAGRLPWRNISDSQAATACAKAGKRLPTNAEWTAAALGTPDKDSGWGADDCQIGNNWPAQPGATGQGRECVSAAGCYDLIGNVWEWVEGTVVGGQYGNRDLPPAGYVTGLAADGLPASTSFDTPDPNFQNDYTWVKKTDARSIARGGYWDNKEEAGVYSAYIVLPPGSAGDAIGFRCAK